MTAESGKKSAKTPPAPEVWANLNEELVAAGLAKVYYGEGEKPI